MAGGQRVPITRPGSAHVVGARDGLGDLGPVGVGELDPQPRGFGRLRLPAISASSRRAQVRVGCSLPGSQVSPS
jgi:hypothetical protein